ncbi:MAG: CPBP family intramembrane metalloprotease [Euryarchaeota archaeon]|nr:CPBP family intramembrane metalloprotease [Euryarchaeota archaeon]
MAGLKRFQVPWGFREVLLIVLLSFALAEVFAFFFEGFGPACGQELWGIDTCRLLAVQGVFAALLTGLTLLTVRLKGAPLSSIGLTREGLPGNLILGSGAGVVLFVLGQGLDYLSSSLWGASPLQEALLQGARDPAVLPALLAVGSVFAPICEEVFFRGFAYPVFRMRAGVGRGIVLASLFFALVHLDPRAILSLTAVAGGLTYLYERTGSLVPSITAHFIINTASFVLAFMGIL